MLADESVPIFVPTQTKTEHSCVYVQMTAVMADEAVPILCMLIGHTKNCAGCSCCTLEAQEKICAHFVRAQAKKLAQLC